MTICSSCQARFVLMVAVLIGCERAKSPPSRTADSRSGNVVPSATADSGRTATDRGQAPAPDGVEFFTAQQLAHFGDDLARGKATALTLAAHPMYRYVQARRVGDGVPEVHDRWTDVTIVHAGRATLLFGGRVEGGSVTSAGEHRGGTIVGGAPRPISTGDLIVIPAGVPHQYRVTHGDSIRYLTIKVATRAQ